MSRTYCSRCLAPLSRREQLFESLLCIACEQQLTRYPGVLPDPNRAFPVPLRDVPRPTETKSSSLSRAYFEHPFNPSEISWTCSN
ncbi:MAG: hypothetical protein ACK4Q4_04680, partial [Rhodocyclaceae bacterium]